MVMSRLAGEVSPERVVEMLEAGAAAAART